MPRNSRYSAGVRARAIRMVMDHREEFPSQWVAMTSVASKLEMTPDALRGWVRRAQIDGGLAPGPTTDERKRLKEFEHEVRDLRRANEILKDASIFFATEHDGRTRK